MAWRSVLCYDMVSGHVEKLGVDRPTNRRAILVVSLTKRKEQYGRDSFMASAAC